MVKKASKALLSSTSPVIGWISEGSAALPMKKVTKPESTVVP